MANCDKGYSFVTDPRNELTSAYLDLLRRACTARSRCLSRGNSWNWAEVNQYMKKEDFRELLGTGMSLTGGQLPRWPELSSLWVENDELGPRGLYVYKGYIIYVVRHHKAKSSTNREFVVVRFLPAELALAVFKYCTYIHPFINLLDRERGIVSPSEAGQSSSPLLFRTQTVPSNSNVWRTSRFTSVIRKVTTEAWGQSEREARERAERAEYLSMIHQDDTEAFERESRRQHQEQTAQEEIRHHHNRSTKRSNYQLHRSKDTTPPPKRRRTLPLSFTSQDVRDQSLNDDNWSHRPLFRYPGDIATSGAMVTRMAVLDHLGTRIGFSDDKNLLRANLKLWTLGEQLEKWCSVGCQLCYVCGDMGLDHKLDDYTTAGSEVARRLLGWLETLHLDRFVGARGNCSLCTETNQICEDIAIGLWVCDASTEEETNRWKRKYMSATDPDGLCGNKPAIRRAIAALCAFDEQLLGKTLTTFISRKNDVDLTIESHAVEWFERKVPHGETWVPQLLIVFDVLVAAFKQYLRRPYQEDQRAAQDRSVSSGPREEQPILAARRIQR
ncbi:hypothetical protein FoTM2_017565 [Fusarium oxysporum f. sp. vasinfectum]|nr:hypothetical protein FoTM2_017565 [Fusarium oxysporum f. sp. vasinfectum]